jgi:LacI family transcriptional regulator
VNQRPVSIRDVAERAGVSPGTVSNVLNRPEAVAEATREAVLAAIDELNYVRNASASRLRAKRNTVMGVLVADMANPFVADQVEAAERKFEEHGFSVIVSGTGFDLERLEGRLRLMEGYRVAGVVVPPIVTGELLPRIETMRARGVSFVFVGGSGVEALGCSVDVDQLRGGRLAGDHLIEVGRRHIVFVAGPAGTGFSAVRLDGFRSALADRSDTRLDVVSVPALTGLSGYAATDEILSHEPDGVFCTNDLVALGVLRGLIERGKRVPEDIALVGYDDISFAEIAAVPLTTIGQQAAAVGATAAELLVDEVNNPDHVHRHVAFTPELVVRQSSVSIGRR